MRETFRISPTVLFRRSPSTPLPLLLPRFCPFRFLHGKKTKSTTDGTTDASPSDAMSTGSKAQPRPLMFGFGRHKCPGNELAKLEIVLFMRTFLGKFDYHLVEGQVRPGVPVCCACALHTHGRESVGFMCGLMKLVADHVVLVSTCYVLGIYCTTATPSI